MTSSTILPTEAGSRPYRLTSLIALVSGAALVVDTVTITVLNSAFDPLDSILFFVGFAGLWLSAVGLAVAVSHGRTGLARVGVAIGTFVALAVGLGVISTGFDQLGRHVFSPANKGLHGEWSFFSIGVCLLILAGWCARRAQPVASSRLPSRSSATSAGG